MNIWLTALRLAIGSLRAYKVRSFLTMLGIIIGIGSVIVMINVGRGAEVNIQEQIRNLGSNMLMIFSGSSRSGGVRGGFGTKPSLRVKDAEAIARECPAVAEVTYSIVKNMQIVAGNSNWGTSVQGTTPEYRLVRNWPVKYGEFINAHHMKSAASVVVLGSAVAENLFESWEDVIGQKIRINNFPFRIIGVMNSKGRTPAGRDQDDVVFVPYTTAMRKLMGSRLPGVVHFIGVSAHSKQLVAEAKREVEELLRQRHRILTEADDDFTLRTLDEIAAASEKTGNIMTLLLTSVAAVSLVVGGIGIMNVMLVSVTERTREIGIRMAVGARERDVLIQFLVESTTMSFVGGLLGILLGIGASRAITHLAKWPTIISIDAIFLATLFSAAVGIFFGFYPARKAASLDPIEALNYE
ncbi:MAG: ABC transporter permease [Deltaproteobacteria bacterium]|nr:MAG: ABC transporter permease [Deltaproteobacteria bacterium]